MKRSLCLVLVTVLLLCCTPAHADRPVGGVRHVSLDVKKAGVRIRSFPGRQW
jgi:hypothetical protein